METVYDAQPQASGIDIDESAGRLVWGTRGDDAIRAAPLDGSGPVDDLVTGQTGSLAGLTVDLPGDRAIWGTQTASLATVPLAGGAATDIFSAQPNTLGAAADTANGLLYFTGNNGDVRVGALDGSGSPTVLFANAGTNVGGVAIDPAGGFVYWTRQDTDEVMRGPIGGSGVGPAQVLYTGENAPEGIAVDAATGRLYWADFLANTLRTAPLDGSGPVQTIATTPGPYYVTVHVPPIATSPPSATGQAATGSHLTCNPGTLFTGTVPGSFVHRPPVAFDSFRWQRDGADIPDADGQTYTPLQPGTYRCVETASNAAGSTDATSNDIVIPDPAATASPAAKDFGPQQVDLGASAPSTFTVSNTGTGDVTLGAATVSGADAADFAVTVSGCDGVTLTAADTCDVQVTFDPSTVGARSATLTVTSNGAGTSSALSGQGFAPEATLSPASAAFDTQRTDTGPSAAATFTLSSAAGTFTVQSAGIAGADAGEFAIAASTCTSGTMLSGAQKCTVDVVFDPSSAGAKSATLSIATSAGTKSSALSGTGEGPPAPPPPPGPGLSLTNVSANRYCIAAPGTTAAGAGKDITIRYTLNGAARMTFTLQRRTSPAASARRGRCPVRNPGGPGPQPVSFGDLGASRLDAAAGENFATVNRTGTVTKAAAAARKKKRKPVTLTRRDKRGRHTLTLRGLVAGQDLSPGWYRVLLQGVRADGSTSQAVAVKFWVLAP